MSHASGAVLFKDGEIMWYEYNGTADVVISHLYKTKKEMLDNWRTNEWLYCSCGNEEDVEIWTSYGYGFCFNGKACKKCMSVKANCDEWGYVNDIWSGNSEENRPEWLINKQKED